MTEPFKKTLEEVSGSQAVGNRIYNTIVSGAVASGMHDLEDGWIFSQSVVNLLNIYTSFGNAEQLIDRFTSNTKRPYGLGKTGIKYVVESLKRLQEAE